MGRVAKLQLAYNGPATGIGVQDHPALGSHTVAVLQRER